MYSRYRLFAKYLRYYITASNGKGHGIHSPFVFDFVRRVLNDKTDYDAYAPVELYRQQLRKDTTAIPVDDLGAGTLKGGYGERKTADIARFAAKPAKYGQLLFRIIQHYLPANTIELGTSLGITTAYLALANPQSPVITLEGAPHVAARAARYFDRLGLHQVRLITGDFSDTLPQALQLAGAPGFVFIDGNHREAPVLQYFQLLLRHRQPATILVFDDIHWSREMEAAWETIRQHPAVTLTIDLFFLGLVFFREETLEKQHFIIRF